MTMAVATPLAESTRKFISSTRALLIDGKFEQAASGKTFDTVNPATGEVLASVAEGDAEDVDRAVRAARRAFENGPWSRMTPSERGRIMHRIGDLIMEHADELAELDCLDNGKALSVARAADIPLAADLFWYMAGWATTLNGGVAHQPQRRPHHPVGPLPSRRRVSRLYTARAGRRGWPDHPLELPAADGRVEDRSGIGHGLHGGPQACRADAAVGAAVG